MVSILSTNIYITVRSFLILFLLFRKSEQNQVWKKDVAKETAYQIGTPLSSLCAWTELLKQDKKNESMTMEMEKDLKRLETITERFSKIGSKTELTEENLDDIISESISYMEKRFSKNIHFDQQYDLIDKKLKINKVLMIWVIENICKNVDAMKGEGLIRIHFIEHEKNVEILISDTAVGLINQ